MRKAHARWAESAIRDRLLAVPLLKGHVERRREVRGGARRAIVSIPELEVEGVARLNGDGRRARGGEARDARQVGAHHELAIRVGGDHGDAVVAGKRDPRVPLRVDRQSVRGAPEPRQVLGQLDGMGGGARSGNAILESSRSALI